MQRINKLLCIKNPVTGPPSYLLNESMIYCHSHLRLHTSVEIASQTVLLDSAAPALTDTVLGSFNRN